MHVRKSRPTNLVHFHLFLFSPFPILLILMNEHIEQTKQELNCLFQHASTAMLNASLPTPSFMRVGFLPCSFPPLMPIKK